MTSQPNNMCFVLDVSTWRSDTPSLYDYEATVAVDRSVRCSSKTSAYAVLNINPDIHVCPLLDAKEIIKGTPDATVLFVLTPCVKGYYVQAYDDEGPDVAWLVVRSLQCAVLRESDTFRTGRCVFQVERITLEPTEGSDAPPDCNTIDSADTNASGTKTSDSMSSSQAMAESAPPNIESNRIEAHAPTCRICLAGPQDGSLITPCFCRGSLQWVHLECLQTWMRGRLQAHQSRMGVTRGICCYWETLDCEICKKVYPTYVSVMERSISELLATEPGSDAVEWKPAQEISDLDRILARNRSYLAQTHLQYYDGRVAELVDIPKPRPPYIVLRAKDGESGLHFINLGDSEMIKMGRGHHVDVRVGDISVSRSHLILRTVDTVPHSDYSCLPEVVDSDADSGGHHVIMQDLKSKFGTLLTLRHRQVLVKHRQVLKLQAGNRLFTIHVRRNPWRTYLPWCIPTKRTVGDHYWHVRHPEKN